MGDRRSGLTVTLRPRPRNGTVCGRGASIRGATRSATSRGLWHTPGNHRTGGQQWL